MYFFNAICNERGFLPIVSSPRRTPGAVRDVADRLSTGTNPFPLYINLNAMDIENLRGLNIARAPLYILLQS